MKTTHTPGPWRVDGLLIKAIDHGKWFGIAKASGTKLTIEGNMANAALIAAAPELLAALINAGNVLAAIATGDLDGVSPDSPALAQIRAAIAKARWQA